MTETTYATTESTIASTESKSKEEDINERVILNVGGTRFETCCSTLSAYPDTLLGAMFSARNRHLRRPDAKGEFFFDRDPTAFQVVLGFYRTGKIFYPPTVCPELVVEELLYFQIPFVEDETENDDGVYTWGRGEYGQLGHGDRKSVPLPKRVETLVGKKVVQISLGTSHSACLTNDHQVYTWGYGGDGRLGHGDEYDQLIPRLMQTLVGKDIHKIVCGELHTAALTVSGRVYTWGLGKDGRLGHADRESHFLPHEIEALLDLKIVQVACGGLHTAALTENGAVLTWGLGKDGRLGHGDESDQLSPKSVNSLIADPISQVLCGGHHTAALSASGYVYTWGFDDDGRLGHGASGHQFTPRKVQALTHLEVGQIACGCWHSAALTVDGAVYTWGSCKSGQLGQAHKNSVPTPRVVLQGKGGGIVKIACGTAHSAALTANGEVYTWGKHDDGRLGYPTEIDQTTPRIIDQLVGKSVNQIVCGVYDTAVIIS